MKGYYGRMLMVNVSDRSYETVPVEQELIASVIGGKGLATRLLLDHTTKGVEPLSADNALIFLTGPATGSAVWGSCRYGVFTKSPQTGFFSESYSGGRVPEAIDAAGYDAIVIKGASKDLLTLVISPDGVEFHSSEDLRGLSTYETEDRVTQAHGNHERGWKTGAVVIGPAGEKEVSLAVIENDRWRSAGRTGTGAVMGSKGIKAIVFNGNRYRELYDLGAIKEIAKLTAKEGKDNPAMQSYKKLGTAGMVRVMNTNLAFPTRYWSQGQFDKWEKISAETMHERFDVTPHACLKCFLACGRLSTIKQGRHAGLKIEGPEYETIFAFGGLCCIDELEEIAYLNDLCDSLGIDTISAGNLCAFTIEAVRRKKVDFPVDYGDAEGVAHLLKKIAAREGIGDILARGIRYAAKTWGLEDIAVHVKGLEPPGYDPRVFKGVGLGYAVSDRGACHLRATFYKAELSGMIDRNQIEDKAKMLIDFEDRLILFDTLILCRFYRDLYPWETLGEIIHALTGIDTDKESLSKIASNIATMVREFNLREGLTKEDDRLPSWFHRHAINQGDVIAPEEIETMVADYYRLRGWDEEGRPVKEL